MTFYKVLRLTQTAVIFFLFHIISAQSPIDEALNRQFAVLGSGLPETAKKAASDSVGLLLSSYLKQPGSFHVKPMVDHLGKVSSADDKLNIYSWNYQGDEMLYKYGCVIQHKTGEGRMEITVLKDSRNNIPETEVLKAAEWYGCLYYAIVVKTKRKKTYYTLLGWDGYNNIVARKIIDVLIFKPEHEPVLGASVFKMDRGTQKRVVFRFSATGSMVLVYDPDYKRIIFDHLSPASPELEGQYQYYGSDFTYDGFKFKRGKWEFEEMLDPRNKND
ncbi:hypothetical protein [Saccharicrinis sp. FJH54]|uniref:hypothetical protein n=1 Tax=Saccharicrinis sp. FJH54 TaxID=3344665 RepID=UPI0035D4A079